jgi:hypothetical protein
MTWYHHQLNAGTEWFIWLQKSDREVEDTTDGGDSTTHTHSHGIAVIKAHMTHPWPNSFEDSVLKVEKGLRGTAILDLLTINKEELLGEVEVTGIVRGNS